MEETIYILINEAMPGYTKIGITKDLKARLKSLSNTSVPVPFECFFAKKVKNAKIIEDKMHATFAKDKVDSGAGREFFMVPAEQVAAALSMVDGEEVVIKDNSVTTRQERVALAEVKKRRPVFNFSSVNIPPGSTLTFSMDKTITCTVIDKRKVKFNDSVVSLSDAALQVLESKGLHWKAVSGPGIWMYEGEILDERRTRFEEEEDDEPTAEEMQKAEDLHIQSLIDEKRGK